MIKKKLTDEDDLDAHLEQLLELQRKKNVKLMKNYQENNENYKAMINHNKQEMEMLEKNDQQRLKENQEIEDL